MAAGKKLLGQRSRKKGFFFSGITFKKGGGLSKDLATKKN